MRARKSSRCGTWPLPAVLFLWTASLFLPGFFTARAQEPVFTDVANDTGLRFVHFNGMTGEYYFPEMTGQGGAFLDYDRDGDLDVYLLQGAMLNASKKPSEAVFPYEGEGPPRDRLFRNDLVSGGKKGPLRFTDVTDEAGIRATGYGMGVATGDYDGDGWVDLYVTNYGSNQLWRNRGDGTFEDVTAKAGADDPRWSTSTSFVDYDQDGHLDLFVTNYVDYSVEKNVKCYATSSRRDYCGPSGFKPVPDRLLRNRGDGTFEDVSTKSGIGRVAGAGLGVIAADFNGDGRPDLFVANDGQENHLWLGQGDGTFQDDALFAGVALNRQGKAEASMGVDAADIDGDGDEDLFMTHLTGETNTLYVNDGSGLFEDRTAASQLAAPSLPYTAFGTAWLDYDNDGWLDLVALNGAVRILESLAREGDLYPLDQPNQLFKGVDGSSFKEVTGQAGPAFEIPEVSRGAAVGDVDNDGDADLLLTNNSGPARLLLNGIGQSAYWLGLRAVNTAGTDALGARLEIRRKGASSLWRRVYTDGSYCSAKDPRVLVGFGKSTPKLEGVRVTWPGGTVEDFPPPSLGAYTELRQGRGKALKKAAGKAGS